LASVLARTMPKNRTTKELQEVMITTYVSTFWYFDRSSQ
jgi:hypothetical protein